MSENLYPAVDEKTVFLIKKFADSIPNYLENPNCPYSQKFKDLISPPVVVIEQPAPVEEPAPATPPSDMTPLFNFIENETLDMANASPIEMYDEIQRMWNQLQTMARGFTSDTEEAQVSSYLKLSFGLLEKVTKMKQVIWEAHNVSKFQEAVLNAMEDLLDADTREAMKTRIEEAGR